MDIDISCDLPAINKLRFSAGLNCNRPIEDIEDIIREELHDCNMLVGERGENGEEIIPPILQWFFDNVWCAGKSDVEKTRQKNVKFW